ncbi:OadG family protein [bacterium]|nr:OadG family protein [bacterium]|tara:strand:- start:11 stop:250 length:240 start_codon:yes stop_codon:yes gene_type:complete
MIGESVNFMITGMTVVFLFLVIMVFVLEAQGKLISYISGSEDIDDSIESKKSSKNLTEKKKVAVVSAAVKHHIKENTKN